MEHVRRKGTGGSVPPVGSSPSPRCCWAGSTPARQRCPSGEILCWLQRTVLPPALSVAPLEVSLRGTLDSKVGRGGGEQKLQTLSTFALLSPLPPLEQGGEGGTLPTPRPLPFLVKPPGEHWNQPCPRRCPPPLPGGLPQPDSAGRSPPNTVGTPLITPPCPMPWLCTLRNESPHPSRHFPPLPLVFFLVGGIGQGQALPPRPPFQQSGGTPLTCWGAGGAVGHPSGGTERRSPALSFPRPFLGEEGEEEEELAGRRWKGGRVP